MRLSWLPSCVPSLGAKLPFPSRHKMPAEPLPEAFRCPRGPVGILPRATRGFPRLHIPFCAIIESAEASDDLEDGRDN
jgi:hypothetical protein